MLFRGHIDSGGESKHGGHKHNITLTPVAKLDSSANQLALKENTGSKIFG